MHSGRCGPPALEALSEPSTEDGNCTALCCCMGQDRQCGVSKGILMPAHIKTQRNAGHGHSTAASTARTSTAALTAQGHCHLTEGIKFSTLGRATAVVQPMHMVDWLEQLPTHNHLVSYIPTGTRRPLQTMIQQLPTLDVGKAPETHSRMTRTICR